MGCYTVPVATAIIHFFMKKKNISMQDKYNKWLNHMLLGAGLFGVIDHLWNGELFLFTIPDVMLGLVITIGIMFSWLGLVYVDKWRNKVRASS